MIETDALSSSIESLEAPVGVGLLWNWMGISFGRFSAKLMKTYWNSKKLDMYFGFGDLGCIHLHVALS